MRLDVFAVTLLPPPLDPPTVPCPPPACPTPPRDAVWSALVAEWRSLEEAAAGLDLDQETGEPAGWEVL